MIIGTCKKCGMAYNFDDRVDEGVDDIFVCGECDVSTPEPVSEKENLSTLIHQHLTIIYQAWIEAQSNVPMSDYGSADELIHAPYLTRDQRKWLTMFSMLWELSDD